LSTTWTDWQAGREVSEYGLRSAIKIWLIALPIAAAFALINGLHNWLIQMDPGPRDPLWASWLSYFILFAYWVAIAPLVIRVMREFPLQRGSFGKNISVQLICVVAFGVIYLTYWWAANMFVIRYIGPNRFEYSPLLSFLRAAALLALANGFFRYYIPMAAVGYVSFYRDLWRKQELQTVSLRNEVARAKLQVLRLRLQPHFLFNTLNSISSLIHEDAKAADKMLNLLSDLLRMTLESGDQEQQVPLRVELDHLRKYLEIEQIRFGPRINVQYDIALECLDIPVPYLLLQPIAENAVRHGVARRVSGGAILVSIGCDQRTLKIVIADNGPGFAQGTLSEGGHRIGVSSTQSRLKAVYGEAASIHLNSTHEGTRVSIWLPVPSSQLNVVNI
jgi:two-component system LytT family sensor kinase